MTYSTQRARVDQRECALYRFWVRHPVTGLRVLGYIGETGRVPFQRLMEHIYSQPWADTIIAWEVDSVTYLGKAAVLAAEEAAIRTEKPLYNYEFNLDNPARIEIWRAIEQRQVREPGWVPPAKDSRVPRPRVAQDRRPATARPRSERSGFDRWWDDHRWLVIGLAGVWLILAGAALRASWLLWDELRPGFAAGAASAPFAAVSGRILYLRVRGWWRRLTRPQRRRSRRRR